MKWSDGSFQLFVGGEPFDVVQNPFDAKTNFIYAQTDDATPGMSDAQAAAQALLKCQGSLVRKMTLQMAHGFHSDVHKKLTRRVAEQHVKMPKIKRVRHWLVTTLCSSFCCSPPTLSHSLSRSSGRAGR